MRHMTDIMINGKKIETAPNTIIYATSIPTNENEETVPVLKDEVKYTPKKYTKEK